MANNPNEDNAQAENSVQAITVQIGLPQQLSSLEARSLSDLPPELSADELNNLQDRLGATRKEAGPDLPDVGASRGGLEQPDEESDVEPTEVEGMIESE